MSSSDFLAEDGYIYIEEFTLLARDIDKYATEEQLKPTEIYFVPKLIPKYDEERAEKLGVSFTRNRAQIIKMKKRMPPAGSRMKMVIVLRLYKGMDDTEFDQDIVDALKAIAIHNKRAEKTVISLKENAKTKRETLSKAFDKNLDAVETILLKAGLKKSDLAIGTSMMGKSLVVRLPNGGFISIGKADKEKFDKAKVPPVERQAKPDRFARPDKQTRVERVEKPVERVSQKVKKVKKVAVENVRPRIRV